MDLTKKAVLTLECQGTLVNCQAGLLSVLHPIVASYGRHPSDSQLYCAFTSALALVKRGTYMDYSDILSTALEELGEAWGFKPSVEQCRQVSLSVDNWPLLDGVPEAIAKLGSKFVLALVTDYDAGRIKHLQDRLETVFDLTIAAYQRRSYACSDDAIRRVLSKAGAGHNTCIHIAHPRSKVLRVAKLCGFTTVSISSDFYPLRLAEACFQTDHQFPSLLAFANYAMLAEHKRFSHQ